MKYYYKNNNIELSNYFLELIKPLADPFHKPKNINESEFETMVRTAAYFLSKEYYNYETLCWLLAERQLKREKKDIDEKSIRKRAKEIFNYRCSPKELCWLIAEIDILNSKKYLEIELKA